MHDHEEDDDDGGGGGDEDDNGGEDNLNHMVLESQEREICEMTHIVNILSKQR